jgi:hypothetical protein
MRVRFSSRMSTMSQIHAIAAKAFISASSVKGVRIFSHRAAQSLYTMAAAHSSLKGYSQPGCLGSTMAWAGGRVSPGS